MRIQKVRGSESNGPGTCQRVEGDIPHCASREKGPSGDIAFLVPAYCSTKQASTPLFAGYQACSWHCAHFSYTINKDLGDRRQLPRPINPSTLTEARGAVSGVAQDRGIHTLLLTGWTTSRARRGFPVLRDALVRSIASSVESAPTG